MCIGTSFVYHETAAVAFVFAYEYRYTWLSRKRPPAQFLAPAPTCNLTSIFSPMCLHGPVCFSAGVDVRGDATAAAADGIFYFYFDRNCPSWRASRGSWTSPCPCGFTTDIPICLTSEQEMIDGRCCYCLFCFFFRCLWVGVWVHHYCCIVFFYEYLCCTA